MRHRIGPLSLDSESLPWKRSLLPNREGREARMDMHGRKSARRKGTPTQSCLKLSFEKVVRAVHIGLLAFLASQMSWFMESTAWKT